MLTLPSAAAAAVVSQEENVNKKRATEASLAKLRALEKSTHKTARLKDLAQVGLLLYSRLFVFVSAAIPVDMLVRWYGSPNRETLYVARVHVPFFAFILMLHVLIRGERFSKAVNSIRVILGRFY